LPSKADKERWQALADKAQTPLSTFCISIIEERLAEEGEFKPRREMTREMEILKIEVKELRDDLRQKDIVLDRYEAELKRYRAQPFQEVDYKGMRRYSKELVEFLKARGHADSYKILEALRIDPRESELVKAVSRQLEELEAYGMIKAERRTWRWIG
jgi:predicted transcriptional regulator